MNATDLHLYPKEFLMHEYEDEFTCLSRTEEFVWAATIRVLSALAWVLRKLDKLR